MSKETHINVSQIRTLSIDRFDKCIDQLDDKTGIEVLSLFYQKIIFEEKLKNEYDFIIKKNL